jgi:hypothetical protein
MCEDYICDSERLILWFENANAAVAFAKYLEIKNYAWREILEDNIGDEAWIFVSGVCDICNRKNLFFAPAEIYEPEITGCECPACGNMSLYPKEGNWENE